LKVSIVTTLYNSEQFIEEFYRRISIAVSEIASDYEIIIVDDGSPDDSLEKVLDIQAKDERVTVVELSRNFGHHKAMMTGLGYARGEYVLMIDTDLEEAPELLGVYWCKIHEIKGADVVYGKLEKRKGSLWEKISGSLFYRLLNLLSGEDMPTDIAFSRLMTANYVKNLINFREHEMYIGGIWHIAGFKQIPVSVKKSSKGISSYTLRKKIEMFINAVTSFSSLPLRMIFYIGLFVTGVSLCLSLYYMARKLIYLQVVSGWTSLIVVLLFMSGMIMMSLGVIAIYLSKIFTEVKNRPYTIVKNIYTKKETSYV